MAAKMKRREFITLLGGGLHVVVMAAQDRDLRRGNYRIYRYRICR
jgi:hypothetical protein